LRTKQCACREASFGGGSEISATSSKRLNGWFSNLQDAFDNYKVPVRHCVLNSKSEIRRLRSEMLSSISLVFNDATVEAFISLDSNLYGEFDPGSG
jgi:hypothetical protein